MFPAIRYFECPTAICLVTSSTQILVMAQYHSDYKHWPFLNEEEFELACAFFDRRYIRAKLGPTRQAFKIRSRRIATTGTSYIEILRLIHPPEDADELSLAFKNLGADDICYGNNENEMNIDEDADEVSELGLVAAFVLLEYSDFELRNAPKGGSSSQPRSPSAIQSTLPSTLRNI